MPWRRDGGGPRGERFPHVLGVRSSSEGASCQNHGVDVETNKQALRRLIEEVFNRGDLTAFDDLVAADYVDRSDPDEPMGRDGYRELVEATSAALGEFEMTIEDLVGEGDIVALRFTATGVHQGEFLGMAPTGRRVSWSGMGWLRYRDGQLVERWNVSDVHGLLEQMR